MTCLMQQDLILLDSEFQVHRRDTPHTGPVRFSLSLLDPAPKSYGVTHSGCHVSLNAAPQGGHVPVTTVVPRCCPAEHDCPPYSTAGGAPTPFSSPHSLPELSWHLPGGAGSGLQLAFDGGIPVSSFFALEVCFFLSRHGVKSSLPPRDKSGRFFLYLPQSQVHTFLRH